MDTESKPEAKRVKVEQSSEPHAEPQTQPEVVQPESVVCISEDMVLVLDSSEAHVEPPPEPEVVQPESVVCFPEEIDLEMTDPMDGMTEERGMDNLPDTKRLKVDENHGTEPDKQVLPECAIYDALSHFPEEMLVHIFSMVEDGKDLHTLSQTTRQFNRILEPSRTQWAFSKVFPLIYSALDKDDILNCRLVCKSWKKTVDDFLPTVPSCRTLEPYQTGSSQPDYAPKYQPFLITKDFSPTSLGGSESIRAFMTELKGHPRNPLVLRDVFLVSDGEGEEYWSEALGFLRVFGHFIWHVGMYPDVECARRAQPSRIYQILREALSLVPNLKTLFLGGYSSDHLIDERTLGCLEGYIQRNPLPALPQLQTFEEDLPIQPNPVMDEIMRSYSGQLKHFRGRTSAWLKKDFLSSWDTQNLPEITYLEIFFEDCSTAWHTFCRKLVAPNLAKLSLLICDFWEISDLLEPLKEELPSLVYLSLKFRKKNRNYDSSARPKFVLEKIKTLEIEDSPFVRYEHLLSHLPRLEYVLVCRKRDSSQPMATQEDGMQEDEQGHEGTDVEGEETKEEDQPEEETLPIRRLILTGAIYQSDVWTRLPFLRDFTVARMGDTEYTEEEIVGRTEYTRNEFTLRSGQGE